MLKVHVKGMELYDEKTESFSISKDTELCLEHSLVSISKWESKWHKPFLDSVTKTGEEMIDYIRCMTITRNVDDSVYLCLSDDNILAIKNYMEDTMTATWFNDKKTPKTRQKAITSELIYYWMISLEIPVEFEKWHINRLLTLIRVCNIENAPKKKMRKGEIFKQNHMLNEARRKTLGTSG